MESEQEERNNNLSDVFNNIGHGILLVYPHNLGMETRHSLSLTISMVGFSWFDRREEIKSKASSVWHNSLLFCLTFSIG